MKTLIILIVFLALVWAPILFKLYSWKEGMILTVSLSIASYLIDKYILQKRIRKDSE